MAVHLGMVKPGSTIEVPFDTFAETTGASITMTGLAVTDIEVYKNGGTTQRASDTGYTLLDTDGIDFDALTGIHGFSIDLSSNADAGFFSAGSRYIVVVSSITVDNKTVSFVAATFSIGYAAIINTTIATLASQTSFTLTDGPAEDDALNGMWVVIHDVASAVQLGYAVILDYTGSTKTVTLAAGTTFTVAATDNISVMGPMPLQPTVQARTLDVSATGEAGVDWANVGSPTTVVGLSGTTIKDATDVETKLGTPAGASVSADIAAIEAQTDDIGAAGAGLTAIPWNAAWDAEVQSEANDALVAYDAATGTDVSAVETDTQDIQSRLPAALVTGRMSSDAVAISGSTAAADAVEANIGNLDAAVSSRSTVTTAQVNTEVVDALNVDTYAEPGQGTPAATTTIAAKLNYLYKAWRNRFTQTATEYALYADDAVTKDQEAPVSDDGTTFTRGEVSTGA